MQRHIRIDECNTGYVVRIVSGDFDIDPEEHAVEHPLDALARVLRWLGYGKDVDDVLDLLGDEVYVLTDKDREAHDLFVRRKREEWAQEREVAALKRGGGRYWNTTATDANIGTVLPRGLETGGWDSMPPRAGYGEGATW